MLLTLQIACVVIHRNGVNVEGSTHKQVVDLIRSGGDTLVLTGISSSLIYCTASIVLIFVLQQCNVLRLPLTLRVVPIFLFCVYFSAWSWCIRWAGWVHEGWWHCFFRQIRHFLMTLCVLINFIYLLTYFFSVQLLCCETNECPKLKLGKQWGLVWGCCCWCPYISNVHYFIDLFSWKMYGQCASSRHRLAWPAVPPGLFQPRVSAGII